MNPEKFQNKYRIPSARAQWWDYGNKGAYFVTLCTLNRHHLFGEIRGQKWFPGFAGELANIFWKEIPERYSYAKIDAYVVMPNHIHGIIFIEKPVELVRGAMINPSEVRDAINRVSTGINRGGVTGEHNPMLHENLSRILNWYKGRVTYEVRKQGYEMGWQERFHDRIIRNVKELERRRKYIEANVSNWEDDEFFNKM